MLYCVRLQQMISVERVLEYTQLPSEAALESPADRKPPSSWPAAGLITARNVCLRYSRDAPLVLKDLSFVINGKEKVRHTSHLTDPLFYIHTHTG